MDFTLNYFSLANLRANKYQRWTAHSHARGKEHGLPSGPGNGLCGILMFTWFLSVVITWLGLQFVRLQSCVNGNHALSLMSVKLSTGISRPRAAHGRINTCAGGQDGPAEWQLIPSVSRELRRNRTPQPGQKWLYDFFRIALHRQIYSLPHKLATFHLSLTSPPAHLCLWFSEV